MGVDAEMFVMAPGELTTDVVHGAACDLAEAVGPGAFMIWYQGGTPRHALAIARNRKPEGEEDDDGDEEVCWYELPTPLPPGWTLLRVRLSGRYYGPGYERGNPMEYVGAAEWIERRFPAALVFYGGDSGEGLRWFRATDRAALLDHWARVGHVPYYHGFDWGKGQTRTCGFCLRPMWHQGTGRDGAWALFACSYCGDLHQTADGGATWIERRADPKAYREMDASRWPQPVPSTVDVDLAVEVPS